MEQDLVRANVVVFSYRTKPYCVIKKEKEVCE